MKFRMEKNLKIINELLSYCHHYGSDQVSMNIKNIEDTTQINIKAKVSNFDSTNLQSLRDTLNVPRQHEIEHYYWHLGGESEFDAELSLVGMMIDEATATLDDGILTLEITRKGA